MEVHLTPEIWNMVLVQKGRMLIPGGLAASSQVEPLINTHVGLSGLLHRLDDPA
jgi:hypothetical protein